MPRKKTQPLYHVNISVAGLRAGQVLELGKTVGGVSVDGLLDRGFLTILTESSTTKESNDDSPEQGRDSHDPDQGSISDALESERWSTESNEARGFEDW